MTSLERLNNADCDVVETASVAPSLPYWLALNRAKGLGPATLAKLLPYYGDAQTLVENAADAVRKFSLNQQIATSLAQPDWTGVEQDLNWLSQYSDNKSILTWDQALFPDALRSLSSPPIVLFCRGNLSLLAQPQLAMVGTRNPTTQGRETAYSFAADMGRKGITITSGLALGIDAAAHQGALSVSSDTIAVMGTGLERVYPARHHQLAHQVAQQGLLISEFTPDTAARPEYFPRRNRLISGLSLGVLVVEAALKSGSLITARVASEQGKEVFAIPGSIHSPMAKGCHELIRQGAKLVECSQHILEELAPQLQRFLTDDDDIAVQNAVKNTAPVMANVELDSEQQRLLEWIQHEVTSVDVVAVQSGLAIDTIYSGLMMLELAGLIRSVPGGYIRA